MSLVYITAKQDAWLFNFGCVAEILRQRASICEMWSVFVCWLEPEEKRERERHLNWVADAIEDSGWFLTMANHNQNGSTGTK